MPIEAQPNGGRMNNHRIMVIDDENIVGKMLRAILEQDGYMVELFLSASPALTRLKEERFDVVITDLKMKGLDGLEILHTVKEEYPQTKVIMITAYANLNIAMDALREKADDFFPKPVRIKDIKSSIERLLK